MYPNTVITDASARHIGGALYRVVPGGALRRIVTTAPLAIPKGVAIDRDGTLVVAEFRPGEPGRILRIDPATGVVTVLVDGWPLLLRSLSSSFQ